MDFPYNIFLLSDGTGETVENVVRAVLTQYKDKEEQVCLHRYKSVRSLEQVEGICEEAASKKALVVYTIVAEDVRKGLVEQIAKHKLKSVDPLAPIIVGFSEYLGESPTGSPGLLHEVNEQYFRRIEAMEFTVKHDDGALPENLQRADIVLLGVSRTSKTPLSIYLSHRGWKVANVPLVLGIEPPKMLQELEPGKVVALTINPQALSRIRRERLVRMGRDPAGDYASLAHIQSEIDWAAQYFARNRRWPVFDVTNKALEETASEIERHIQRHHQRRKGGQA